MTVFSRTLDKYQPSRGSERRWVFVPYDQLHDGIGPLGTEPAHKLGIVMIESRAKAARRGYHKQKLALVLTNMRHFAIEQAARGVAVHYIATDLSYAEALQRLGGEFGTICVQRPAEYELRQELAPLVASGTIEELPHDGWLTEAAEFQAIKGPPWRMDAFYRRVRHRTGILMDGKSPIGGKFSFDADNRKPWKGKPAAPTEPTFVVNDITREVCELVVNKFASHPGELRPQHLAATRDDAAALWSWALENCLPTFGPYEDAMSTRSSGLFHTRVSPLLNLHRLLPERVVNDVLAADIDLASKEGFVRQVIGWREFVHHVHDATNGLRTVGETPLNDNVLQGDMALPAAYWGTASGLNCLDHVIGDVWREAYSHHITRLMVLGNLATLLGVIPRQVSDWFWVAYADAYDWVVEPNVMAMATYGVGDLMTTKPYVAGSAYIARMSDYCKGCAFDPKKNCPITRLYWQFLARNEQRLAGNVRIAMPLRSLAKRAHEQRELDQRTYDWVRRTLEQGEVLLPTDAPQ